MKVSPSRLTLAREAAGLTKKALAAKIGLAPSTITAYEDGTHSPIDHLGCLADALGMSGRENFFFGGEVPDLSDAAISFRSRRALLKRTRQRTIALSQIASFVITPFLEARFDLPMVDLPDDMPKDPESAATELRSRWGLGKGPIDNMVHLLEAKGVLVYFLNENCKSVDAFTYYAEGRPFAFLNLLKQSGERGRFDAAHELGHLILHRDISPERLGGSDIEAEANAFASAFLMPREQFLRECPKALNPELLLSMKPRWRVSIQAMVRRGRDIGVFSQWEYEMLYRKMSALGWRSGAEIGQLPREDSSLQFQAFSQLMDAGLSVDDLSKLMQISKEFLYELMPISRQLESARSEGFLRLIKFDDTPVDQGVNGSGQLP